VWGHALSLLCTISLRGINYPQEEDKFFKNTEISISFVRPPYPDVLGISAGQKLGYISDLFLADGQIYVFK
jgi:hypothetical protein